MQVDLHNGRKMVVVVCVFLASAHICMFLC